MAVGVEEPDCGRRRRRRKDRVEDAKKLLIVGEKVEVRSIEDGFLGSWHTGTIIACSTGCREVRYEHLYTDDCSKDHVDVVSVSSTEDGISYTNVNQCNSRGRIRPVPCPLKLGKWGAPYGLCVDVYFQNAWWEGVIFDHEDGSEERKIFFPDSGDEKNVEISSLRITQDWNEFNETWHRRGTWLFLELVEEYEQEECVPISVKQIWYDLREKKGFKSIGEWTISRRGLWKELISEVIGDNQKMIVNHIHHVVSFSDSLKPETKHFMEASHCSSESNFQHDVDFLNSNLVPVENSQDTSVTNLDLLSVREDDLLKKDMLEESNQLLKINFRKSNDKKGVSAKRRSGNWLPAGSDIVPGAEYNLDAVIKYVHMDSKRAPNNLVFDVRKHLKHMGWTIEYIIDSSEFCKVRYFSPNEKVYYSLRQACKDMMNDAAIDIPSLNFQAGEISLNPSLDQPVQNQDNDFGILPVVLYTPDALDNEPENCPREVVESSKIQEEKTRKKNLLNHEMKLKARRHLSELGWEFRYRRSRGRRFMLGRKSPKGRSFFSVPVASKILDEGESGLLQSNGVFDNQAIDSSLIAGSQNFADSSAIKVRKMQKLQKKRIFSSYLECHLILKRARPHAQKLKREKSSGELIKLKDDLALDQPAHMLPSNKSVQGVTPRPSHQNFHNVISWLIDNHVVPPRVKVLYCKRKDSSPLAEGMITRDGITCCCCRKLYTLSGFGDHAGATYHMPAAHVFLEDGTSLLKCQKQALKEKKNKAERQSGLKRKIREDENDSVCAVCHYGGELIMCDLCPSSFHKKCLGLKDVPDGDWFCPSCRCGVCGQSNDKEKIGHLKDSKAFRCVQCEHMYHAECLPERNNFEVHMKDGYFCGEKCEQIYMGLQKLLGKPIPVSGGRLTWTLLKYVEQASDTKALNENHRKLDVALSAMHECFEPVKEAHTQRDLIEDVIFSRRSNMKRINFRGFHTIILEKDNELITVASVRIFGKKVAEIPLIGTRFQHRRQGMCQILMSELEKKLMDIGVERLVLPSVPSALDTWTGSFGFSKMTDSERLQFLNYTFLVFQGTVMCQKLLTKTPSTYSAPSTGHEPILRRCNVEPEVFGADQILESRIVCEAKEKILNVYDSNRHRKSPPVVTVKKDARLEPKRSRGRPRLVAQLEPKRSRGRPRLSTQLEPKRSRGRPRLTAKLEPKRSRGRPRLVRSAEDPNLGKHTMFKGDKCYKRKSTSTQKDV